MSAQGPLSPLLLAHLPGAPAADAAGLEEALQRLLREGQAAWPEVPLAAADFLQHLARHAGGEALPAALGAILAADLYLACGCARGLPAALRRFDEAVLSQVRPAVARICPSSDTVDEVVQIARARLLVAQPGEEALIGQYAGRGSLLSWVRVTAVRIALNLRSGKVEQGAVGAEALDRRPAPSAGDTEIEIVRARHRGEFEEGLRAALAVLTVQQRNLLRAHYLDGLTLEQVAGLFQVHRATVVRWLAAAREAILREAQRLLQARLGVDSGEFASLAGVLRSQLDLSFGGLLDQDPAGG